MSLTLATAIHRSSELLVNRLRARAIVAGSKLRPGLGQALGAVLAAVTLLVAQAGPTAAHQDGSPSPNGVSPWHYTESWAITGSYYGEGYHVDWLNGVHYNDYYALDWAIPGDGCNKRL